MISQIFMLSNVYAVKYLRSQISMLPTPGNEKERSMMISQICRGGCLENLCHTHVCLVGKNFPLVLCARVFVWNGRRCLIIGCSNIYEDKLNVILVHISKDFIFLLLTILFFLQGLLRFRVTGKTLFREAPFRNKELHTRVYQDA